MKRSMIALAVLVAAGSAAAQSSVTLFGVVDTTLIWGRGSGAAGNHRFQVGSLGYAGSRLGFRGREDLGGGLWASFWLEMGFNPDTGTGFASSTNNQAPGFGVAANSGTGSAPAGTQGLTFNRTSYVALGSTSWGQVRLGRDYTGLNWQRSPYDPFIATGAGAGLPGALGNQFMGPAYARASNSIGYFFPGWDATAPPRFGNLSGQIQYFVGENPSSAGAAKRDGSGWDARVRWTSGPFDVAVNYFRAEYSTGDAISKSISAAWDFSAARVVAQYTRDEVGPVDAKGGLIGAQMPLGPGVFKVSWSRYGFDTAGHPTTSKAAVGYVYALSKRTNVYTTFAHQRNRGGAAVGLNGAATSVNGSARGLDIGLFHSF